MPNFRPLWETENVHSTRSSIISHLRFVSPGARDNTSTKNSDGITADVRAEKRLDHGRLVNVPHVHALVLMVLFKKATRQAGKEKSREREREMKKDGKRDKKKVRS